MCYFQGFLFIYLLLGVLLVLGWLRIVTRLAEGWHQELARMPIFYLAMLTAFFYSCIFYLFVNKHYLYSSACFRFSGNQKIPSICRLYINILNLGCLKDRNRGYIKPPFSCRCKNPQFVAFGILQVKIPSICRLWDF